MIGIKARNIFYDVIERAETESDKIGRLEATLGFVITHVTHGFQLSSAVPVMEEKPQIVTLSPSLHTDVGLISIVFFGFFFQPNRLFHFFGCHFSCSF